MPEDRAVCEGSSDEEELYTELVKELRRLARVMSWRRTPTFRTSDLVEEATLNILSSSRTHLTKAKLKGIGGRAIRQVFVQRARYKGAAKRKADGIVVRLDQGWEDADSAGGFLEHGLRVDSDLEDVLWMEEVLRRVEEALGTEFLEIAVSQFYAGMSVGELAEYLGLSQRTVHRRLSRLLEFLQAEFGGSG